MGDSVIIIQGIIKTMDWIKNIISQNFDTIFTAIIVLLSVYIGAWLTKRQIVTQRKLDFCEKQLREFYSPLVGIRKEIETLSKFRVAGEKARRAWWQKIHKQGNQIEDSQKKINSSIEYDNKQLEEKLIPAYRKMVDVFKNNYWLAEEETKDHFSTLIKFVETWERFLSKTHPSEVIEEIQVQEEELIPFYKHIEAIHKSLREKLKKGEN